LQPVGYPAVHLYQFLRFYILHSLLDTQGLRSLHVTVQWVCLEVVKAELKEASYQILDPSNIIGPITHFYSTRTSMLLTQSELKNLLLCKLINKKSEHNIVFSVLCVNHFILIPESKNQSKVRANNLILKIIVTQSINTSQLIIHIPKAAFFQILPLLDSDGLKISFLNRHLFDSTALPLHSNIQKTRRYMEV